jgi:phospholipid/cholesterol/gamma-HCH transport system substrate-binding protein
VSPLARRWRPEARAAASPRPRQTNYVLVGLAAIAAIAVFSTFAFQKRVPFVDRQEIQGVFASSNGLRSGSPVRIAGVDVGKVRGAGSGPGATAIVTMEIRDEGLPIHRDATLRVRPRVFLEGGYYVDVNPGTPSAPVLADEGRVPLSQTSIPVQFDQLLTTFTRPTRQSFKNVVKELDAGLREGGAEGLRRTNRELAPALLDVAWVTEAARGIGPHDLSSFIGSAAVISDALARHDRELAGLVVGLNRTTRALASRQRSLRATVRELDGVLRETPPALDALDRALPPTERFTAAVRPALRVAPPVLEQTSDTLVEARALLQPAELPELVDELEPAVDRLPLLVERLDELFGWVWPVVDCVRERALPVLYSEIDDGHLSTGRPVWQDLAHAFVGLAGATQSFDGNGMHVRYLIGLGSEALPQPIEAPGGDLLTGLGPKFGARPKWLGLNVQPPFRPDKDCRDQEAPDLDARTGN